MEYLQTMRIFHRDLKPQNVLIHNNHQIKIGDFGLSRIISNPYRTLSKEIETLWYRAPELLLGEIHYDTGVDTWSLGCILYELVEGKVLFQGESEIGQLFKIFEYCGTPSIKDWPEISSLPYFKVQLKSFSKHFQK